MFVSENTDIQFAFGGKPSDIEEKTDKWFESYSRWVANQYNPILPSNIFGNVAEDGTDRPLRWADRILETRMFIYGIQDTTPINYMAMDELNNPLPIAINNDETIYELYKHLLGSMVKKLGTLDETIYAKNITNEALEYRNMVLNVAKAKIEAADVFRDLNGVGVSMNTVSEDEIERNGEETVQDVISKYFTAYSKDWLWKTDWETWAKQAFMYLMPAYFCRAEIYTEGGYVKVHIPRPEFCIWDNSADHEFGKLERYQGTIHTYTAPELFREYPDMYEDETIRQEVQDILTNSQNLTGQQNAAYYNMFQNTASLLWWQNINNIPLITVVKAKFQSLDEDGKVCWYMCDLIGNKWIRNKKKVANQRVDPYGNILPPDIDYIPDMQGGFNRSDFHRMINLANQIKGLEAKINLLVVRAKGKIPVFLLNKLKGMDTFSLMRDVANGLVFIPGVDIDQLGESDRDKMLSFILDLSADYQGIQTFRSEIEVKKNQMRDIASIPLLALGTQTDNVGKGVQNRTIEQATFGQLPLTYGYTQWINNVVQAACDVRKGLIYLQKDDIVKESLQITKRQFQVFEVTKDFTEAQLQIYITAEDEAVKEMKAFMMQIFEREAQIPDNYVDSTVVVEAMQCNTVTEMITLLNYKKKVWDQKREKAAAEAAKQQQINNMMTQVTQENIADKQVRGNLANEALKQEGGLESQANDHAHEANMATNQPIE